MVKRMVQYFQSLQSMFRTVHDDVAALVKAIIIIIIQHIKQNVVELFGYSNVRFSMLFTQPMYCTQIMYFVFFLHCFLTTSLLTSNVSFPHNKLNENRPYIE